jgi:anti-anti-sigma factor
MSVSAGERGPLITLSGEADITNAAELSELINAQLSGGTRHLAIDAAGLAFADSASVHVLLAAARTLNERGGSLLLLRPQRPISVVLQLIGVSELITVREETAAEPGP